MNDRKKALLSSIVKEHIRTGSAVGSKLLVDKYQFGVSSATLRNEMLALEKDGFLTHQHTSAGRVPTEKGWKYYLDNFVKDKEISKKESDFLTNILEKSKDIEADMATKRLAKALAELSKQAVIVGFTPDDVYYTGISHLFSHQEFRQFDLISHMTEVIDHLDDVVHDLFPRLSDSVEILVGNDNPFGKNCGVMVVQYHGAEGKAGLMGILGPIRMDYSANMGRLHHVRELLENNLK
ncbi:hypothetical protein ACFL0L_03460 [Patescibacteria group bacterium]